MEKLIRSELEKNLVSIIIPVYNSEKYLTRCLESVINQSYKTIETILINDGSTDNSGEICKKYFRNNQRFKIINIKNNGPAFARNLGIKNSDGEFILFLDSDDFIETNAVSSLMESYNLNKTDLIIGDFKKFDKDNKISNSGHEQVFSESKFLTKKDIVDYVKSYLKKPNRFPLFVYSWGRLFKSKIIKENNLLFNEDLRTFEDVAFNFDYLNHIENLFFKKESLYNHLINEGYVSTTMSIGSEPKKLFGYKYGLSRIVNFFENDNPNTDIQKEIGHADVCYTIIQLVRTCGQINKENDKKIYELINDIVSNPDFRNNLRFYSPSKGDSKLLPILMKLKLSRLIMNVCRYKAYKRYEKNKGKN